MSFQSYIVVKINVRKVKMKRCFDFIGEDKSRKSESAAKFWEVSVSGTTMSVRFEKIGANG